MGSQGIRQTRQRGKWLASQAPLPILGACIDCSVEGELVGLDTGRSSEAQQRQGHLPELLFLTGCEGAGCEDRVRERRCGPHACKEAHGRLPLAAGSAGLHGAAEAHHASLMAARDAIQAGDRQPPSIEEVCWDGRVVADNVRLLLSIDHGAQKSEGHTPVLASLARVQGAVAADHVHSKPCLCQGPQSPQRCHPATGAAAGVDDLRMGNEAPVSQ